MEKTNRYIYKGTMVDFKEITAPKPNLEEFEQVDYSAFKKLGIGSEKKTL